MVLDGSIDPTSTVLGLTEGGAAPDRRTARSPMPTRCPTVAGRRCVVSSTAGPCASPGRCSTDRWLDFVYGFVAQQSSYALLAQVATLARCLRHRIGAGSRRQFGSRFVAFQRNCQLQRRRRVSTVNCLDYSDRPSTSEVIAAVKQQRRLAPRYGERRADVRRRLRDDRHAQDPVSPVSDRTSPCHVGASRDGWTIVQWTARMSRAFPVSRTVTYAGGQHVTWGSAGSDCVDAVADDVIDLSETDRGCPNAVPVAQ